MEVIVLEFYFRVFQFCYLMLVQTVRSDFQRCLKELVLPLTEAQ